MTPHIACSKYEHMEQFAPFLLFKGTFLFIMLYLAETDIHQRKDNSKIKRQINLYRHSPIPLARIRHLPHSPWFSLQTIYNLCLPPTRNNVKKKASCISFGVRCKTQSNERSRATSQIVPIFGAAAYLSTCPQHKEGVYGVLAKPTRGEPARNRFLTPLTICYLT
jgi:hypothetical protein